MPMTRYQAISYQRRLTTALVALLTSHVFAQSPAPAGTAGEFGHSLDAYRRQHLQEKIFVHTDKDFYLSGEICWYKLYVVDAVSHRPLDLSKVAYLEWLDKDNKPVLQAKAGLAAGHGDGSLYLPLTLRSGHYTLRAYTAFMKNFGVDWFFEKKITVVNGRRSAETPAVETPLQYPVAFFPEGGNLVEELPAKIGFRITDQYGRGVECTGVVTQDDEDTVARFSPYRFGIGSFTLTPHAGHRYRAIFRLADGTAINSLLPTAGKAGTVMSVVAEGQDQLRVNVQSTGAAGGEAYLVAHTRGSVKTAIGAAFNDGKASFLIDKKDLGEGISQLTLFNAARQPVCERLVFKQPAHPLAIALHTDKNSYSTREQIKLAVDAGTADCSLSVFRVEGLQGEATAHIAPYLWLAADLKGKIESPGYYFEHPEDVQAMDNLMLTHGWRRFRWEDVLAHRAPELEFPPEYNGAIISGKLVDTQTGAPAPNVETYLSVPGTRTQFTSVYSDAEGRVRFELKDFYGGQEIIVQTNFTRDSIYRVEITNPFAETYADNPPEPLLVPRDDSASLLDKDVAMQVLNRYGGEKLQRFRVPGGADTTVFYFKADHSYMLDDYTRFTTMEEVMREYVTLMLVQRRGGHYHLPLFDMPYDQFFDTDPLVLLDGVPIFNLDSLLALDPLKLKRLETVQRKYFLGGTYYPGILNWTTYKGDLGGYILDPHSTVIDYEGLTLQREFYSPSYATEEDKASHVPDFRNVLYWKANATGEQHFYSSDIPGRYIVVAEGLGADGAAGSGVTSFEVK